MADVRPIPNASVAAATQVNAGLRISARSATRRSPNKVAITNKDTGRWQICITVVTIVPPPGATARGKEKECNLRGTAYTQLAPDENKALLSEGRALITLRRAPADD